MAELLIRVADKEGADQMKGHGRMMAGDVVAAMPDGHVWSVLERANPAWRIIHVPGLLPSEVTALVSNGDGDPRRQFVHKRKHGVDVAKLSDVPTLAEFRAAVRAK